MTRTTTSLSEMGPSSQGSWPGRVWGWVVTALLLMLAGLHGLVYLIVVVLGLLFLLIWFLRFWGWT